MVNLLEKARAETVGDLNTKAMIIESFIRENVELLFVEEDSYNYWVKNQDNMISLLSSLYLSEKSDLSEYSTITKEFVELSSGDIDRFEIFKALYESAYYDGFLVLIYVINMLTCESLAANSLNEFYDFEFENLVKFTIEKLLGLDGPLLEKLFKEKYEALM